MFLEPCPFCSAEFVASDPLGAEMMLGHHVLIGHRRPGPGYWSPDTPVDELSGGERQGVAIARAMYFKTKVLILDEPTNHLSVKETNKVLSFVEGLKTQGITSIFITHNLHHVYPISDRIVVMPRGDTIFEAGDAVLFDDFFLHRTAVGEHLRNERYAIESWFFAPSHYPIDQIPVAV